MGGTVGIFIMPLVGAFIGGVLAKRDYLHAGRMVLQLGSAWSSGTIKIALAFTMLGRVACDVLRMKKGVERELNSLLPRPCLQNFAKNVAFFRQAGRFQKKCSLLWLLWSQLQGTAAGQRLNSSQRQNLKLEGPRTCAGSTSIWQHLNANESLGAGSSNA